MLRAKFHMGGDSDIIEYWPDETGELDIKLRAIYHGCPLNYDVEVSDVDSPDADGGSVPRLRGRDRDDVHVEHESQR